MVAWRRTVLASAALAAALVPVGVLAAQAADPPSTAVGIGAREFRLSVYRTTVPRGVVRFNLVNYGEDRHDLVVRGAGGRQLARSAEVRAGGRATVRVRLGPGRYTLVCDVADHAGRGMRSSIRVTR